MAAIVNSNYESRLSSKAAGDKGRSTGLFQINDKHGLSKSQRMNPATSIKFILGDFSRNGSRIVSEAANGASIARLSGYFGHDIVRPSDPVKALTKRAAYAQDLFPTIANLSSQEIEITT